MKKLLDQITNTLTDTKSTVTVGATAVSTDYWFVYVEPMLAWVNGFIGGVTPLLGFALLVLMVVLNVVKVYKVLKGRAIQDDDDEHIKFD